MSYAKYGIDVHEKTVTNQLAHQGCATLLTGNVFAFTSYLTRLIFGPLRKLKVEELHPGRGAQRLDLRAYSVA